MINSNNLPCTTNQTHVNIKVWWSFGSVNWQFVHSTWYIQLDKATYSRHDHL